MVHEQIIDSPEQQILKSRIIEMRVDVHNWSGGHDLFNLFRERNAAGFGENRFHRCTNVGRSKRLAIGHLEMTNDERRMIETPPIKKHELRRLELEFDSSFVLCHFQINQWREQTSRARDRLDVQCSEQKRTGRPRGSSAIRTILLGGVD